MVSNEQINVIKRNGRGPETLDIDKIHSMVGFATEGITGVSASHVEMNITEELVMVTGRNHEQEEAVEELEAEYNGQSIEVGFNASYLQDILQAISGDSVRIDLQGADTSCLVSVPNNEDLTYVVMPMRI